MANHYDVYYRAHVQDKGWLGWACNDQVAGTTGFVLRLEAFQVVLVEKGSPAPGDTSQPSIQRAFSIKAHVSNLGWQSPVYEGMTVGTTGRNLAVEALTINKPDLGYSGRHRVSSSRSKYRLAKVGQKWKGCRYYGEVSCC